MEPKYMEVSRRGYLSKLEVTGAIFPYEEQSGLPYMFSILTLLIIFKNHKVHKTGQVKSL